jgi:hypothetical protein
MLWLPPAVWCQGSPSTITGGSAGRWLVGHHELGLRRHGGGDRGLIRAPGGGEDQPRRHQIDDVAELAEILRDQRVGGEIGA